MATGGSNDNGKGNGSKPPLMKRSVVSSFLYKFVEENGQRKAKIALFKRSGKVRTYPHRWAVVSGSIDPEDPSPQAAAWREIQEETTLTYSSLELMRQGKSYVLPDESIGREWTIYPFAFRLKDASEGGRGEMGITLDWEHEDWAWYDPTEIEDSESFGAVPRLAESLRRVWFEKSLGDEAGAVLTDGLYRLKQDHDSGARQMAVIALQILREIIAKMSTHQLTDHWWAKVRFAAWHVWKNGRESMGAAILSALLAALKSMETSMQQTKPGDSAVARDVCVQELDRCIARRQASANAVSLAFASFLRDHFAFYVESGRPMKILTVSESSTIKHALRHIVADTPFALDLRILESRPLFEGVSLANSLVQNVSSQGSASHAGEDDEAREAPLRKLQVTLFTDASSAIASHGVDIVLLGADRIAEAGDVSNKTGSLPAVLSAKHITPTAKIVILSESEKIAPPAAAGAHVVEHNDPRQVTRAWEAEFFNSGRIRDAASTISRGFGGGKAAAGDQAVVQVKVRNVYFEWVPAELIDVYVTENGIATSSDIRKFSEALGIEEERFFSDI
ncbi:unnamed protein product [Discula destructiva]